MNDRDLARAKRRRKAERRLPPGQTKCGVCGYDDPHALELHHIAGRKYDDAQVAVCRNHHRTLSDWQRDHALPIEPTPNLPERIVHLLQGAADLLELLVKSLRAFADELLASIQKERGQP